MVYICCFDRPYHHARHYTGSTDDLDARIADHRAGRGAKLMAAIVGAGIGFDVVCTLPGGRVEERRIKKRKNAALLCPRCRARTLQRRRWKQCRLPL
jgi:hypothetical protein